MINRLLLVFVLLFALVPRSALPASKSPADNDLMMAIMMGDVSKARAAIDKGANINSAASMGMTPLSMAVSGNRIEIMKVLIGKGADVNAKGPMGTTALMTAADNGNVEAVKLLLDKGADINAKDNFGRTAFLIASSGGKAEIAKLLDAKGAKSEAGTDSYTAVMKSTGADKNVDQGVKDQYADKIRDIKARSNDLGNALIDASKHGDLESVKMLLNRGADVNSRNGTGQTPLLVSSRKDVSLLLIDKGADVTAASNDGRTVLMEQIKDPDLVRIIVAKGADVNARDRNGVTVLMRAAGGGSIETIGFLLNKGANIKARDNEHATAFYYSKDDESALFLLDHGVDTVEKAGADDLTPLMFAAIKHRLRLVTSLAERGVDVNVLNKNGQNALLASLGQNGDIPIDRYLIEHGSDIRVVDKMGNSAILYVNNVEIAELLVKKGANVNAKDRHGATQIHLNAGYNEDGVCDFALVKFFVEHGADVKARNDEGGPPFFYAANGWGD